MSVLTAPLPSDYDFAQISWSGCKDSQTSADTWEAGVATGAMSYVRYLGIIVLYHYRLTKSFSNPS